MRSIQPCNTDLYCTVVTLWHHCVLHRKLAIKRNTRVCEFTARLQPQTDTEIYELENCQKNTDEVVAHEADYKTSD